MFCDEWSGGSVGEGGHFTGCVPVGSGLPPQDRNPIPANNASIGPLKGQAYLDALNAYCSARGRAKFIADWVPGSESLVRNLWNSPTGEALGFYQLPTADVNRLVGDNSGGQTIAFHTGSELLKAAATSTNFLYQMRAATGVPMTVGGKILNRAAWFLVAVDAAIGYYKEAQEILACQAGN